MRSGSSGGSAAIGGVAAGTLVLVLALSCSDDRVPGQQLPWPSDAGADVQTGTVDAGMTLTCIPSPRASEDLSPRVDVTRPSATVRVVKTSDLFARFNTVCGRCHVSASNGGFQATLETFPTTFDAARLARVKSEDPSFAMPPEGKAFSSRPAGDPVRELVKYLEPWIAQGRPRDMFAVDGASVAAIGPGAASYAYSAMTNIGDCVPVKAVYASSPSTEMDAKDTYFASITELPADLSDTDLTTLDTAALAANGVIAFRPTYPLWSDGSGKLRFVRVPKGTSIKFDKDKQTFDIPTNTRFYKTFFREVTDKVGQVSHRKMETRLIVTRPDTVDADGMPKPEALYGTYVWSDDEMSASLLGLVVGTPYRDGTGFADRTAEYVTNEVAYQDIVDNLGPGAGTLEAKLHKELLDPRHAGLIQHYAIPGSLRCVQCHRGSPSQNFVLGFTPLQIAQRAANTGGVFDPVGPDELNQLQRLIDYGVISGMATPGDVVGLENSQPPRHPRTDEELKAQAYMIGNCAHCHNPRGYPSLAKPELAPALNFLPRSTPDAGIFEFSLERMSPVRSRGANQDIPIPYVTPSLRDYPVADTTLNRVDNGSYLAPAPGGGVTVEVTWSPKYDPVLEQFPGSKGCAGVSDSDREGRAYCGSRRTGHSFVAAPWRSIIYRNVDTPFPYFDDYVPFPHMPMNTAGFDCRAPRIMGDWMVSLPARLKPELVGLSEDALPHYQNRDGSYFKDYIDLPQPYQEVKPDEEGYADALEAARSRLAEYHGGVRYQYCQDVLSPDIFDPIQPTGAEATTVHSPSIFYPVPERFLFGVSVPPADPTQPGRYVQPALGVPYHAEWFDYDPTDAPPPWQPRRGPIWEDILVNGTPDTGVPSGAGKILPEVADARRRVIETLQKTDLTDGLRTYATTEVAYGLWQAKPECAGKLAGVPKASDPRFAQVTGAERPAWMDQLGPSLQPDAPVYMIAPGAALYRHICINCHGPKADGKGLQGDALAASSEGKARPANLAGGLFGPPEMPGQNLLNVFGLKTGDQATADRWGSRYMAWMTLGGTLQLIPHDVINQVEATKILGSKRQNLSKLGLTETVSANMLNLAKALCAAVLPDASDGTLQLTAGVWGELGEPTIYTPITSNQSPFLRNNGDWQMWMNFCSVYNRPVIRVYGVRKAVADGSRGEAYLKAFYYADDGSANPAYRFPADGQVWDHNKQLRNNGVTPDNYYPACFQEPSNLLPGEVGLDAPTPEALASLRRRFTMPACPSEFLQHADLLMWSQLTETPQQIDNMRKWALRGAINAGMSVFSYLEKADLSHHSIQPYYNECQLLP